MSSKDLLGMEAVAEFFRLISRKMKDRLAAKRFAQVHAPTAAKGESGDAPAPPEVAIGSGYTDGEEKLDLPDRLESLPLPEEAIPEDFSLLWPLGNGAKPGGADVRLDEDAIRDLGLEAVIRALSPEQQQRQDIRKILLQLCSDPLVIRYRQDVVETLLRYPELEACFEDLTPRIAALSEQASVARARDVPVLYRVIWQLSELEIYVESIKGLVDVFSAIGDLRSEGLRCLRDAVVSVERDEVFRRLVRELPDMVAQIRGVASVTIGVNLDSELRPSEATLISVNKERFTEAPLLAMLLGGTGEWTSVTKLHGVGGHGDPMMIPLFRDLSEVMKQVCTPIEQAFRQYVRLNTRLLANLGREFAFYVAAVRLIQRVRASGLPVCKPELAPQAERICEIKDNYNMALVLHLILGAGHDDLRELVTTNDVTFGPQGRILILTGPNQGGKTTYVQAVGLSQVLAQAGLYIPGAQARISPVDGIYTHFPIEEKVGRDTGRLGDESRRLSDIFAHATRCSLILLNESLSSTAAGESLYLAQDIVRILRLMGARAIFATHLHELAAGVEALNAEVLGDSQVVSLVASLVDEGEGGGGAAGEIKRTYRVVPSPPMGYSYAQEIARRYGISYDQLKSLLEERGVLH